MKQLVIYSILVQWVDGGMSNYTVQAIDESDVQDQLIDTLYNVRDQILSYQFKRVGSGQEIVTV
jgi:hypothetical protein